ncbi:hypothetical protein AJ79_07112 [Helicocarpus griseus UAMH5409]|uniref:Uncharacterized protein n=1 Tax=Helicocarpus griseus UAMH5409 TaxID=1447875 RepID=A0A2B7X6G1_9EURO|nr:hypothetical protein AJ79_07112 [Helicocarpus griseus UAMH5409]
MSSTPGLPFSLPGDSGALVISLEEKANVTGLLFGPDRGPDVSYVTPIESVFKDIEFVTGGKVIEPAEDFL